MKEEVVTFARKYYSQYKKAPSVRTLAETFRDKGLNRFSFYKQFPGGIKDLCQAAGIPVSNEVEQTRSATMSRKASSREADSGKPTISLTENQVLRLYAICHLEGGRDPSSILDEILERDFKFRKNFRLSMVETKKVSDFLDKATARGWTIHGSPSIIDCLTDAWNAGILSLDPEILRFLTKLAKEISDRKWSPKNFVEYATRSYNLVVTYSSYKEHEISADEFRRRLANYVQ